MTLSPPSRAAWIEIISTKPEWHEDMSPPSRAAWIEISSASWSARLGCVAAFTGGVD